MTALQELIARLEKATGPSRELDAEIAAAIRYHPYGPSHWIGDSDIEIRATGHCVQAFRDTGESCGNWQPPAYTSSIDATLTLVPDGWRFTVGDDGNDYGAACSHKKANTKAPAIYMPQLPRSQSASPPSNPVRPPMRRKMKPVNKLRTWDAFAVVEKDTGIIDFESPDGGTPIFTDKSTAEAVCDPADQEVIRVEIRETR